MTRFPTQFLEIASKSLEICNKYDIPLLINDRLDIAIAIGAHGVHLGQTDMPVSIARRLLPQNAIIGKTCNNVEHVKRAVEEGVDYVGLGPVWGTKTKNVTAPLTGPRGIGVMLDALEGSEVKAVAIGKFMEQLLYSFRVICLYLRLSKILSLRLHCGSSQLNSISC